MSSHRLSRPLLKEKEKDLIADKERSSYSCVGQGQVDAKMNALLEDSVTYKKLDRDPVSSLERRLNAFLLQMKKKGSIRDNLYYYLRSSGGRTPLLYGLPKMHIIDVPLCPIVSFVNSPSYQLSKHLAKILSPLVGNSDPYVRNASDFVSFVGSQIIQPDEVLVVSLFTNVPVDLALDVARCIITLTAPLPPPPMYSYRQISGFWIPPPTVT